MKKNYYIINLIFAGVIGLIFLYSGIFSSSKNNHPAACIHKEITGVACKTCGFSNAFSELVRGNFIEARAQNPIAPSVFIFFLVQLLMRGFFLVVSFKLTGHLKEIIITDASLSVILFLWAFRKLLIFW